MSAALAAYKLSQTQRRYAHDYKRMALKAQSECKPARFERLKALSNKSWQDAKDNLRFAKIWGATV